MSRPGGDMSEFYEDLDQLMTAARVVTGVVIESIEEVDDGLTLPQMRTLILVASRPGVSAEGVAEDLRIHTSNATRLIDRLIQVGYLSRSDCSTDRRRIRLYLTLYLTAAGRRLVDDVIEHRRGAYQRVLRRMTVADRQLLAAALRAFAVAADEPDAFPADSRSRDPAS